MNFSELWLRGEAAQSDSINVQRIYIDINNGSLIDGVMFSQIMYWHGFDKQGKTRLKVKKDGEYWLVKRYEDWWEECRVNEHTARKSINRMIDSGLLIKEVWKFDGSPTTHIRINWIEFELRVKSIWQERTERSDPTGQNEVIPQDRTLTETTTKTTTEKDPPPPKFGKSPLEDIVNRQSLINEDTAPNPKDQWFEYSDKFIRLFQDKTGRYPNEDEKTAISDLAAEPSANPATWEKALSE